MNKKSPYDLSGPELKGWAKLADVYHKERKKRTKKEIERRRGKSPYDCG